MHFMSQTHCTKQYIGYYDADYICKYIFKKIRKFANIPSRMSNAMTEEFFGLHIKHTILQITNKIKLGNINSELDPIKSKGMR